jgi:hypothetical protein
MPLARASLWGHLEEYNTDTVGKASRERFAPSEHVVLQVNIAKVMIYMHNNDYPLPLPPQKWW